MKKTGIFFILILLCEHKAIAQLTMDTSAIKSQLEMIFERDQKTRTGSDSSDYRQFIDSSNLAQVESLIARYGWMGKSVIGAKGNHTLWLVIQHADLEAQKKYLPMLQKSVDEGESRAIDLAYLQDRILMREDKKQIYGTQVIINKTGGQELYPIEDVNNVNLRRQKLGMESIEEYAKRFGIEYKLP